MRKHRRTQTSTSAFALWSLLFLMIGLAFLAANMVSDSDSESLIGENPYVANLPPEPIILASDLDHATQEKIILANWEDMQKVAAPDASPSGEEAISRFYALVAEYNRTVSEELLAWSDETKNRAARIERAHMVSYYTFCCLRYYYLDQLDAGEKTWLFANLRPNCNLPRSIFYDYPGPIATAPPTRLYGDVRKEFELFIYQSIWEVDYQCEFYIINDEVAMASVRQEVRSTMKTLGVRCSKVLHE